jgi:hypothetical protein
MVTYHYQWRYVNASVPLACLCKDVTGIFFLNLEFALFGVGPDASGKNVTFTSVF